MAHGLHQLLAWLGTEMDELLFPAYVACLGCGCAQKEADVLCAACRNALCELEIRQQAWEQAQPRDMAQGLCGVHAAYPYEGVARTLILRLKYDGIRAAAAPLTGTMMTLSSGEEELLVPVPTSRRRQRRRGFNQAELLARRVSRVLGVTVCLALTRQRERPTQSRLSFAMRQRNLVGCMNAVRDVRGRRVLLIDDVYTTGATAKEAARALLCAGAVSVRVWTVARTHPEQHAAQDAIFLPQSEQKRG